MAHARKMVRKNKPTICTDANQHAREHAVLVKKKIEYATRQREKMMEEYRRQYEERKAKEAEMVNAAAADNAPVPDVVNA